jgi:WD40 repeat protein
MYGHLKAVKCLTSCVPYNNNNNNKTDHFKRSNLFASCSWDRTIKIWSLNCLGHTCLRTLYGHQDYLSDLVYVQESNCLISGAWDKSIRIWSLNTYECVRVVKMNSPIKCLTFDATRAQLMCGLLDKSVRVLDLERNEFEKYLKIFSTVNCFVLLEN